MVQGIDDQRDELGKVAALVPFPLQKARLLIGQVCRQDGIEQPLLVGLIELLQPVCEQSEGCTDEDPFCLALFQLLCNLNGAFAGGDHVIDDDDILAGHVRTEEFVRNDRMLPVHGGGIIPSLVKHAHIDAEHVGHIDGA